MDQGALVAVWATKDILSGEPEHLFPDIFFGWRVRRLNLQRRANERESPGLGVMGEPAEEAYVDFLNDIVYSHRGDHNPGSSR